MIIPLNESFNFKDAVKSHGWWMLAPNHWNEKEEVYSRTLKLKSGKNVLVSVVYVDRSLIVEALDDHTLSDDDWQDIQENIVWIFRLEENFESFYALSEQHNELMHIADEGKGRLLRSPTLFEDVVKVILTTNTRWQQTINMSNLFVEHLGETVITNDDKIKTFPTAERILEAGEDYLKEHIRVGYRSTYLMDAAEKTVDASFDLESYQSSETDISALKTIKGVGPYAYSTLSMLLGKYDSLPIDSVYRDHVTTKYFSDGKPSQKELETVYEKWEDYKFLAYWFDE